MHQKKTTDTHTALLVVNVYFHLSNQIAPGQNFVESEHQKLTLSVFASFSFQVYLSSHAHQTGWKKKIPCVSAKQLKPYPKLVPTETQRSKSKHLHKFLEGLRMQLYLMPLFFVLVPEISGVFHAEKMSIIIRCIIRYEFLFHFPFKVHFWGGIQEQYDLGNKLPFSTQGIFLMLIM